MYYYRILALLLILPLWLAGPVMVKSMEGTYAESEVESCAKESEIEWLVMQEARRTIRWIRPAARFTNVTVDALEIPGIKRLPLVKKRKLHLWYRQFLFYGDSYLQS